MDQSNIKGKARYRYAKLQPLSNRINETQRLDSTLINHHPVTSLRCDKSGISESYDHQLQNVITRNLALANIKETAEVISEPANTGLENLKTPLVLFDETITIPRTTINAETTRKQKRHMHKKKEKLNCVLLRGFKTKLRDVMKFLLYIIWSPVIVLVKLLLIIASLATSILYSISKLFSLRSKNSVQNKNVLQSAGKKQILLSSSKEEDKQLAIADLSFLTFQHKPKTNISIGPPQSKKGKSRGKLQSSTKKFNISLEAIDEMRGKLKSESVDYIQHILPYCQDNFSGFESGGNCLSDKYCDDSNKLIFGSKNERKKSVISNIGEKKPPVSTLRNPSSTGKQVKHIVTKNSCRRSELRFLLKNRTLNNRVANAIEFEGKQLQRSINPMNRSINNSKLTEQLKFHINVDKDLVQDKEFTKADTAKLETSSPRIETVVSQYSKEIPELEKTDRRNETKTTYTEKNESPEKLETLEKDLLEFDKTPTNRDEEQKMKGSGDCLKAIENEIKSRTVDFTNPIDAKSRWIEMKKKFYGKDYAMGEKHPEKLETTTLPRIQSSSQLPAHKIFQYNMLVGRARQMGTEVPSAKEIFLEKKITSPCLKTVENCSESLGSNPRRNNNSQSMKSAISTSHCLSHTQSLSQWPSNIETSFTAKKYCSLLGEKPKPKPRTIVGFNSNSVRGEHKTSTMICSAVSSSDIKNNPVLEDESTFLDWPLHMMNTTCVKDANLSSEYTEKIDSLISFCR